MSTPTSPLRAPVRTRPATRLPFWSIVGRAVYWGPLLGGLPYAITLIGVPFAYFIGVIPALIGSSLFAWWLRAGPVPGAWHCAAFGAIFGGIGCLIQGWGVALYDHWPQDFAQTLATLRGIAGFPLFVIPHGVFAGAVLGAFFSRQALAPATASATSTDAVLSGAATA